jgi:hypothetical protein
MIELLKRWHNKPIDNMEKNMSHNIYIFVTNLACIYTNWNLCGLGNGGV